MNIYLLPGRGGKLNEGLGAELLARGHAIQGRELRGAFQHLGFAEQVDAVASDLRSGFWHENSMVIANSFGAYLFLHALTTIPPYVGQVLLLSPIIGEASDEASSMHFVPPRNGQLQVLLNNGSYPIPRWGEIHLGQSDWQCDRKRLGTAP